MKEAILLAEEAHKNREIPVGAVIVNNGKIIGKGYNRQLSDKDPTAHAEIVALRRAAEELNNFRLDGSDMYVTIKPCKMCREALSRARIDNVYYSSQEARLATHGVKYIKMDKYNSRSSSLIKKFFKEKRK